jgi:hypothetical protein
MQRPTQHAGHVAYRSMLRTASTSTPTRITRAGSCAALSAACTCRVHPGRQSAPPQSEGAPAARFHDRELCVVSAPVGTALTPDDARACAGTHTRTRVPALRRAHKHMRIHAQMYARAAAHSMTGMRARALTHARPCTCSRTAAHGHIRAHLRAHADAHAAYALHAAYCFMPCHVTLQLLG